MQRLEVSVKGLNKNCEIGRACNTYGRLKWCIMVLVWKPQGNRSLGRTECRWEDNIASDRTGIGWKAMISLRRRGNSGARLTLLHNNYLQYDYSRTLDLLIRLGPEDENHRAVSNPCAPITQWSGAVSQNEQRSQSSQGQIKHQLVATRCRFYFCRVTLHVSGFKRPSSGVLKNWHGGPWYRCYSCRWVITSSY